MAKMAASAPKIAEGVRVRARRRLGKCADLARVAVPTVPLVIVATKDDRFLDHDVARRKELVRASDD